MNYDILLKTKFLLIFTRGLYLGENHINDTLSQKSFFLKLNLVNKLFHKKIHFMGQNLSSGNLVKSLQLPTCQKKGGIKQSYSPTFDVFFY